MKITSENPEVSRNGTTFQVLAHPYSKRHLLLKVTTRKGLVYACASSWEESDNNPQPSGYTVEYLWKHNRHLFMPYNEATGSVS